MDNLPISNIPGPESISKNVLKNGATILCFKNMDARSVYMIGILTGSGVQDPLGKIGLAHFTANLLSRGTKSQSFSKFHNQLESVGANLSFSCGSQHAWFRGKALAEDMALLFRQVADGLREPAFRQEYIDRLRGQLLTGLTIRNQDTSEMASLLLDTHLFPKHPYGHPIDGYIDTIQSITRTDIVQFHARNYAPNELITVVVGPIDESEVRNLAEAYFASWEKDISTEPAKIPLPNPPSKIIRKHKYIEGKSQVDLLMGCFGPARTSLDYTPVYVGNNILGQFGLMGRIGKSVRSRSGLAYYASSSVTAWSDVGTWEFSAGVNPENVEKTVNLIRKEIGDFTKRPVFDDELDNSKSHLIGRMPMSLESNAGLANAILTMRRFDLGLDYYQNYKSRIQSVTASQILESSKKYLHPDRLIITSAGTGKDIL